MKSMMLAMLAAGLFGTGLAFAAPITYSVTGTFSDGAMLSGTVAIDTANFCFSGATANFTETAGSSFAGQSYTNRSLSGLICDPQLPAFILQFDSDSGLANLSIDFLGSEPVGPGPFAVAFVEQFGGNPPNRDFSTTLSAPLSVPEPATLALLGLGLAGLGFARRKTQ